MNCQYNITSVITGRPDFLSEADKEDNPVPYEVRLSGLQLRNCHGTTQLVTVVPVLLNSSNKNIQVLKLMF